MNRVELVESIMDICEEDGIDPLYSTRMTQAVATILHQAMELNRAYAALENMRQINYGEGGTMRINPATGWPVEWGDMPRSV